MPAASSLPITEWMKMDPCPYDPAKAKQLLAEAGYPKGFDGGTFYPFQGQFWPQGEMLANCSKAASSLVAPGEGG
jgi:ABC-type transport system substrate-binding protein